jgi:hypothetical protein
LFYVTFAFFAVNPLFSELRVLGVSAVNPSSPDSATLAALREKNYPDLSRQGAKHAKGKH